MWWCHVLLEFLESASVQQEQSLCPTDRQSLCPTKGQTRNINSHRSAFFTQMESAKFCNPPKAQKSNFTSKPKRFQMECTIYIVFFRWTLIRLVVQKSDFSAVLSDLEPTFLLNLIRCLISDGSNPLSGGQDVHIKNHLNWIMKIIIVTSKFQFYRATVLSVLKYSLAYNIIGAI